MEAQDSQPAQKAGLSEKSSSRNPAKANQAPQITNFTRAELNAVLRVYGMGISKGLWRDYAIDYLKDAAVFSIFRRSGEHPLYRIEKRPKLQKKQGAFSVVTQTGQILKRGQDLNQTLRILERKFWRIVESETL